MHARTTLLSSKALECFDLQFSVEIRQQIVLHKVSSTLQGLGGAVEKRSCGGGGGGRLTTDESDT